MLIWQGWGILVLFAFMLPYALLYIIHNGLYGEATNEVFLRIGGLVAATLGVFLVWLLAKRLEKQKGRVLIDKATAQEVTLKPKHTLFFIDVKYWPVILAVGGAIALLYSLFQPS